MSINNRYEKTKSGQQTRRTRHAHKPSATSLALQHTGSSCPPWMHDRAMRLLGHACASTAITPWVASEIGVAFGSASVTVLGPNAVTTCGMWFTTAFAVLGNPEGSAATNATASNCTNITEYWQYNTL